MSTDPIVRAARFLETQLEWLRHSLDGAEPYAVRAFAEIDWCAGRMRSLVNGPPPRLYLGSCGALVGWDDEGNEIPRDSPCTGQVYGNAGAKEGSCRVCGARWAAEPRRAALTKDVHQRAFRASEIEDAYGVKANLIRQWATPARNLIQVHGEDREGRALYLLSQVLDVAAAQKAKHAEQQAKRARRTAERDERMSA